MRSSSRRPDERRQIDDLLAAMEQVRSMLGSTPAHSAMDYDQAAAMAEDALWLAGFASRVVRIRVQQSGKSAARAARPLSERAI